MKNCIYIFFVLFSIELAAQNFEHIKDFEDVLVETDKYNMSSVVEGDDAFFFAYRVGTDYFFANRFQLSKTDLEGNTIFHKEILAPAEMQFSWGFNHATPPPMTYADGRICIVLAAYLETTPYTPVFYQFIFDTDGNIIQENTFDSPIYQEFSNVEAASDGFVFISTEANVNAPESPASLHIFKSDFDGNMLWQKQYQFVEDLNNTMYAKGLTFDNDGNIYIAVFQFPYDQSETQGTALFKLDSEGEFIFLKKYVDEGNFTGAIRNICLAFNTHNLTEELYMMSSWSSVLGTNRSNFYKLNTDGEVLASKQAFGIEYGSALIEAISDSGCTVLVGKENGDGISNSFENSGDPILINLNTELSVDWAYAYGGDDFHYTDDLINTKDDNYLIVARSATGDYLIKTDENGTSVCETLSPTLNINDLEITEIDKEAYELIAPMNLIETPASTSIDILFYEPEDKCCPGGIPIANFEYSFANEAGLINFTNDTSNGDSYSWTFGDGDSSFEIDPNHTFTENGTYEICLTAENDCGVHVYCENISLETIGIDGLEIDNISLTSTHSSIELSAPLGVEIVLYNSLGQIIYQQNSTDQNTRIETNTKGIYFCKIMREGKLLYAEKIIVL